MEVIIDGGEVAFTLPKDELANREVNYMLFSIGVSPNPCAQTCKGWEMVREANSNTDLIHENFVNFPIKYAVTLPNMRIRELEKLTKGTYSVVATFSVIKNNEVVKTKKVVGGFTVE